MRRDAPARSTVRRGPSASRGASRSAARGAARRCSGLSRCGRPGRRCRGGPILDRAVVQIPDVRVDAEYPSRTWRSRPGTRACSASRCSEDGAPIGVIVIQRAEPRAVHRRPGRAPADLRRPGGDRDRERAPVHRAGRAQQRAAGRARAADRDQRAAQGDRPVHLRSPAGLRDAGRERGPAVCGRASVHLPLRWDASARRGQPQRHPGAERVRRAESHRSRKAQRYGARRSRAANYPHSRCPGRPRVHLRGEGGGPPRNRAHGPPAQGRRVARGDQHLPARGEAVHRQSDRPDGDLRRPGGHRHRERAAADRAPDQERRPHRGPGAADGDRRDPARDLELADRSRARSRHGRARTRLGYAARTTRRSSASRETCCAGRRRMAR